MLHTYIFSSGFVTIAVTFIAIPSRSTITHDITEFYICRENKTSIIIENRLASMSNAQKEDHFHKNHISSTVQQI